MIYFDNGATSYPKPDNVIRQTVQALKHFSFNSGRGGYRESLEAADKIYAVREKVGDMFGFLPENVVFTKNCTEALNTAIKGSITPGGHIIISSLEHNSVARVTEKLLEDGVADYDIAAFSFDEQETVNHFESLVNERTQVIVCMYASNAFGVTFPIQRIGKFCREKGIRLIVDGAQGAGVGDINAQRDNIDILCAPGHKGLMAPMGTGFMAVREGLTLQPLTEGGTGSASLSLQQPDVMPDRFESGTLNNAGIIGLGEGIDFIQRFDREAIYEHELSLAQYLFDELSDMETVQLYTPRPEKGRAMPVLSFNLKDYSSEKTAALLAEKGVCVRAGFHCAPLAHRHFQTLNRGTVRLSIGCFNRLQECSRFINVVKKL